MTLNDCDDPNCGMCGNPCCPNRIAKIEARKTRTVLVAVMACLVAVLLLCSLAVKLFAAPTLSGSGSGAVIRSEK